MLPWSVGSFVLILPSGLAMFAAHASDFIAKPVFALKICLILAAGITRRFPCAFSAAPRAGM